MKILRTDQNDTDRKILMEWFGITDEPEIVSGEELMEKEEITVCRAHLTS